MNNVKLKRALEAPSLLSVTHVTVRQKCATIVVTVESRVANVVRVLQLRNDRTFRHA